MSIKLLSKKELASLMNVSINKIDRDMLKGLPYKKFGGSVRFNLKEVENYYDIVFMSEFTSEELETALEVLKEVYTEIKQRENK